MPKYEVWVTTRIRHSKKFEVVASSAVGAADQAREQAKELSRDPGPTGLALSAWPMDDGISPDEILEDADYNVERVE